MSTNTVPRWLKNVMAKARIDTSVYKAHSTITAVTSVAKGNKVPIDNVLSTAGWSSESTFDNLSKTLPNILGMSYCIIAVNTYDMSVSTRLINQIVTVRSLEEI